MPLLVNSSNRAKAAGAPRRICILGLWHQATVLSASFAQLGHHVRTVGDSHSAVAELNRGKSPVLEPGLNTLLRRGLKSGKLQFTTDYREAMHEAEFVYLSIDTPVNDRDEPQLESLFDAIRNAGKFWKPGMILCVTSQAPVGTSEKLSRMVSGQMSEAGCDVAYIPEFLRLGDAVGTFRRADRFVIGADRESVVDRIAELYLPLRRPILWIGLRSAEMAKHACNTFLATSISFINEIADLCDCVNADSLEVAQAMKLDRRIGPHAFLSPGLGFAGGTLGREIRALQELGRENRRETPLMDAVMSVNLARARAVRQRLIDQCGPLNGLTIGILGITYKPGTSTLRRSVALELITTLVVENAQLRVYDPLANWKEMDAGVTFTISPDPFSMASGCDALVLVTEWDGILDLNLGRLRAVMRHPVFIDARNLFDPRAMLRAGFHYSALGRGTFRPARAAGGNRD
jgi:UDPglucose 6-dehydrogenase